MKFKKSIIALSIGAMALGATSAPAFASVVASENFNVPNGVCTMTIHYTDDNSFYTECSCDTNVDKILVSTKIMGHKDGQDISNDIQNSSKTTYCKTSSVTTENATIIKGWSKVIVDGKQYPSTSGMLIQVDWYKNCITILEHLKFPSTLCLY